MSTCSRIWKSSSATRTAGPFWSDSPGTMRGSSMVWTDVPMRPCEWKTHMSIKWKPMRACPRLPWICWHRFVPSTCPDWFPMQISGWWRRMSPSKLWVVQPSPLAMVESIALLRRKASLPHLEDCPRQIEMSITFDTGTIWDTFWECLLLDYVNLYTTDVHNKYQCTVYATQLVWSWIDMIDHDCTIIDCITVRDSLVKPKQIIPFGNWSNFHRCFPDRVWR